MSSQSMAAGNMCLSGGRRVSSSGDWDLGNPAFAISHGSRDTTALTPGLTIASLACCCSFHLSAPGKPLDPRTLLRVHPGCAGDTTERLAAQFASRSSDSRRGVGPSLRSAYRTRHHARTPTGLPRFARMSCDRGGYLLYPEDGGARPGREQSPAGTRRFAAASPYPSLPAPTSEARVTRHQRRFTQFTRPIFPSPVRPGWDGLPLGFALSSEPRRPGADDARQGGDRPSSTGLKLRAHRHQPNLRSARLLITCVAH